MSAIPPVKTSLRSYSLCGKGTGFLMEFYLFSKNPSVLVCQNKNQQISKMKFKKSAKKQGIFFSDLFCLFDYFV